MELCPQLTSSPDAPTHKRDSSGGPPIARVYIPAGNIGSIAATVATLHAVTIGWCQAISEAL